jgi:hypothetical protein
LLSLSLSLSVCVFAPKPPMASSLTREDYSEAGEANRVVRGDGGVHGEARDKLDPSGRAERGGAKPAVCGPSWCIVSSWHAAWRIVLLIEQKEEGWRLPHRNPEVATHMYDKAKSNLRGRRKPRDERAQRTHAEKKKKKKESEREREREREEEEEEKQYNIDTSGNSVTPCGMTLFTNRASIYSSVMIHN